MEILKARFLQVGFDHRTYSASLQELEAVHEVSKQNVLIQPHLSGRTSWVKDGLLGAGMYDSENVDGGRKRKSKRTPSFSSLLFIRLCI